MKKTISIVLLLVLGMVSIGLAAEDTWTFIADISGAREFPGGGVIDGKIYIIGGAPSDSSVTSVVEMYDPILNTWTRMSNMPSGRCGSATCIFDGKIYVFGGVSPNLYSTAKRNVFVYDPETDEWTQKNDMPYAKAWCSTAVVDDTIYLIGGMRSVTSAPISTVMAYDPVTESWTQKSDMPTARGALSACVVDGKIYAIGGATENWRVFSYKLVEVYDPSTGTWTRKSDMPTERWGLGTSVVDGKIYAVGGWSGSDACTTNEVYDPITDTWMTKSPMQQKRNGSLVCSIDDKIYAIGGAYALPQPGRLSSTEEYDTGLGARSPDFNGDGIVDSIDICILVEHWQMDYPLCDIAPPPFGDGIVDVQDLIEVAEHLFEEIYPPELIAYWKLDEAEGDIALNSISDNHGLLSGNPAWQPETGKVDGAIELDGIDDYIDAGFVLDPAEGSFSVFVWIKGGAPGQAIISQIDGTGAGEIWLGADTSAGNLMTGLVPPPAGRFVPQPLESLSVITDSLWHHVGFVWDGGYRILYFDGTEIAKDTAVQNPLKSANGGLYIGARRNLDDGTFFSGLIDDVRIYNIALTSEQIAALVR